MPRIKEIEEFKTVFNNLGDEPAILRERGEEFEDIPLSEEAEREEEGELKDLLEGSGEEEEESLEGLEPGVTEEEPGLAPLEDEVEPETEPVPEPEAGLPEEEGEAFEEKAAEDIEAGETEAPEEEEEEIPSDEELEALLSEFEEEEEAPEEEEVPAEEPPEEKEVSAVELPAEEEAPEEEFELPSLEEEETEAGTEEEVSFEDEFELPDLEEEETFAEEEAETPLAEAEAEEVEAGREEEAEAPTAEEAFDEETLEAPPSEEEEEFSLPPELEVPEEAREGEEAAEDREAFTSPEEAGEEEAGEIEEDFSIDEFNLGDISEEFGLEEEEEEEAVAERGIPEEIEAEKIAGELEEAVEEFSLSDEDFRAVQNTLATLPRNLKIIIEELIGEQELAGENLRRLADMLISGESARNLASFTGKITGKKIVIPSQYEKKTGREFELEKGTLAYLLKETVLPVLRIMLVVLIGMGVLGYIGYNFLYRPIYAQILYSRGYQEIEEDDYTSANQYFDRGYSLWAMKRWFFRYAEAFVEKKQYTLAEGKYERLLNLYPSDKKTILDYASLKSEILAEYEQADRLLKRILEDSPFDYEALLSAGDNYLRWAEEDFTYYEEARRSYATLIQKYGAEPKLLYRMLKYFIRTDNLDEVVKLKDQFLADKKTQIDPSAFAELGGYLIEKNILEDVQEVLFRALKIDNTLAELHYNLARYYRRIQDFSEEKKALRNALNFFEADRPLSSRKLAMLIDTYNRMGEAHIRDEKYLEAEEMLQRGIELYEDALSRKLLARSAKYGKLYENLADIYYYQAGDYDTALVLYNKAEGNLHSTPDINYKKGYINYLNGNYMDSLLEFYEASGGFSANKNLMFATANTLFMRNDYFAAQGYYNHLLDTLEREISNISSFNPAEERAHRALLEYTMKVYNNLGVTLFYLSRQSKDRAQKEAQALVNLAKSSEYFDFLTRDPDTMERAEAVNLGYLNSRRILYPQSDYELSLYIDLPRDMNEMSF